MRLSGFDGWHLVKGVPAVMVAQTNRKGRAMAADQIPLAIYVSNDDGFRIHCAAGPEDNNGEPCMWTWPIRSEDPGERWTTVENAINHALERHMGPEYRHTKF